MKNILKVHKDVITVPETMKNLIEKYVEMGYQVKVITSMNFKIVFQDGWVHVFWEKGSIYQEIFEEAIA